METVVHIYNEVMVVLNWLAVNLPWGAIAASGILSGLLIGPQKAIKRWYERNEQIMITLIAIVGPTAMAAWTYILHHYGTDPRIVVVQGLAISFMTQPFYFMVYKPYVINKLIPRVAKWIAAQVAAAEQLNEVKTAVEPAGGLPVAAPDAPKVSVPIQDFKP